MTPPGLTGLRCDGAYSELLKRQLMRVDGAKYSEETLGGFPFGKRKSLDHVNPKSSFSRSNIHL